MVVQHNLSAMNANRMYNLTQASLSSSTEKLSSGYKINKAADDASGLSISEKMRKQIRGLTQASSNAEDGISMVQTAEGALSEVTDMLQRMNELAVKAANGTNSETDRSYIQDEIDQLVTEVDRVSTTTKFNETYLLKGDNANDAKYTKATSSANLQNGVTFNAVGTATVSKTDTGSSATTGTNGTYKKVSYSINGKLYAVISDATKTGSTDYTQSDAIEDFNKADAGKNKGYASEEEMLAAIKADNSDLKSVSINSDGKLIVNAFADTNDSLNISLHVGADSSSDNKINVNISNLSARGLGLNGLQVSGEDDTNATNAIDTIADAIQKVSTQRSNLGAIQNRLEHTVNNLDNIVENTTAAESQIRDTDMATEMVKYSNANILSQAGQSMLAQANQSNQGVLSLLG
jgi:flagellin